MYYVTEYVIMYVCHCVTVCVMCVVHVCHHVTVCVMCVVHVCYSYITVEYDILVITHLS